MKPLHKYILALAIVSTLVVSCRKHAYYQTNPNNPTTGFPGLLLTNILASTLRYSPTSNSYAHRHLTFYGGPNVNINYNWTRASFGDYDMLRQVKDMDEKATASGENSYRGIAKFLRAFYFARLTETFGDVPYSDAMKALEGVTTPKYDPQKTVYTGILNELEEANTILSNVTGRIDGDIIYGNKPNQSMQWRKLINAFRLRLLIHLSKKESDASLNIKQQFQQIMGDPTKYPLMTGNTDNAQIVFNTSAPNNSYPTFQSLDLQTLASMEKGFVDMLKNLQDPRLFKFADPISGQPANVFSSYAGVDAGLAVSAQQSASGSASRIQARYYNSQVNEPQIFFGYAEQELLIAEAIARNWITGPGTAKSHYDAGVAASMSFYGINAADAATYLAGPNVVYNSANAIQQIITQKYISFFMNSGGEAFFEHRRTGIPTLSVGPATGNGGLVPKRWMYPQNELTNNNTNLTEALQRQFSGNDNINGIMWVLQ
jgi:hypothetical protein